MNVLKERYGEEIEQVLAKYPADQKRSAVMPLLYIAQRERGYITRAQLDQVGEILGISSTDVASIVGFYTLYHDKPEGKYRIQVCNDLPLRLPGALHRAPMFQVQSRTEISYHEDQTVDKAMQLVESWRQANGQ